MLSEEIISSYEEYWEDKIANLDYSDIDAFAEENNLSEDEIEELLSLVPSVNFLDCEE
jgi:hypothetical protein